MMTCAAADRSAAKQSVAVTRTYLCPRRDQMFLLPVSMREWIPEGHLAWLVLDVVAEMDTSGLHQGPCVVSGRPPYEPEMMCALVLYAYCRGIRSSRQIEAGCVTDAAFRVICGGLAPDHTTISRFVAARQRALGALFCEGLRLCSQAGLADLSVVALDGTKVAADASLSQNRDREWIEREVAKLIAVTAESGDSDSGEPGGSSAPTVPSSLGGLQAQTPSGAAARGSAARLGRLRAALAVIDASGAQERAEAEREATQAAAQAAGGRMVRGRKPSDPQKALARAAADHAVALGRLGEMRAARERRDQAAADGERALPKAPPPCRIRRAAECLKRAEADLTAARDAASQAPTPVHRVNVSDPDSRIVKTQKCWVQGYNAQAIASRDQIVVACHVSQDAGDIQLLKPMVAELERTLAAAGITAAPELMLADAGYSSEANATCPGPDRLIATQNAYKRKRATRELGEADGPPPPHATAIEEMEHLLRTPQGARAYAERSVIIEPIFGNTKHNRSLRGFRRRGLDAVRGEWAFVCLASNMLKLHHRRLAQTHA
jgi:transposase